MPLQFLDFEQPIAELEAKIEELRFLAEGSDLNTGEEIDKLRAKARTLTNSIFANLTPWQITQLARHPQRPYTLDYIPLVFTEFQELHGDRMYADDQSIVGGVARLTGTPVMLIGQQKGRDTKERVRRNYGMPKPEGYRKARRLMLTAERFGIPVITLIDTPGAYPGVGSEERNQSEAIARNLFDMSRLAVPIVSCVIGEGGSGGALAIGVCDRLLMLQYSVYSVISPEGCASILWKSADRRELAAEAMGITAERLSKLDLIDEVLPEPLGGAHREPQLTAERLRDALTRHLSDLTALPVEELLAQRRRAAARVRGLRRSLGSVAFDAERLAAALDAIDRGLARSGALRRALGRPRFQPSLLHAMAAALARGGQAPRPARRPRAAAGSRRAWAQACRATCDATGVPLEVTSSSPLARRGREPRGRRARCALCGARRAISTTGERLLTAHHRDDQLETVLIQLLRGAGVAGLAAMPARARARPGLALARPLLDVERAELAAYSARHALAWHEDPMNEALRFDRGWLRARVLPAIRERWPAASATVARSAAHWPRRRACWPRSRPPMRRRCWTKGACRSRRWAASRANARSTCCAGGCDAKACVPPPAARLAAAMPDFLSARRDAAPCMRWDGGELRRYRGRLYAMPGVRPGPASAVMTGQARWALEPGLGCLELLPTGEGGLRMQSGDEFAIRFRAGGESLRPHPERPRKRLKDLCQESAIVPWMRDRLPLLYVGGRLAAVGDLWIDAEFVAPAGATALKPVWTARPRMY